ncbi:MAG TPA: hypothetical protein VK698_12370 [Kofleriaceae bacterium]|nr:hypothetical protein [Kofleriaceae bacterium]
MTTTAAAPALDQVAEAARRFELPALLRVLRRRGFGPEAVFFESVRGAPVSPALIDSLRFEDAPRRVVVRLNAGLLAADGPLPGYFRRFADDLADPRPFLAFLRFFEHVVARNLSYVAHPADGVAQGSLLPRAYQTIAGARSPARLHALARAIVPELPLEVFAAPLRRREPSPAARLGSARLDGTALVGFSQVTCAAGFVVRWHADSEVDDHGRAWADVVRERCERRLVPLLRRGTRAVELRLRLASYAGRAEIGSRGQLGREPLGDSDAAGWEIAVLRVGASGGGR